MFNYKKTYISMKNFGKYIFVFILLCFSINSYSQVEITQLRNSKVADLVQKYLVGPNIELVVDSLHLATFNGDTIVKSNAIGSFVNYDTTGMHMPMDEGLVIVTGPCIDAGKHTSTTGGNDRATPQNNDTSQVLGFYYQYCKDCIEKGKKPQRMMDIGSLVFWIKPKINNFAFTYSFASKEYNEGVGKAINDFYGFFFSGPYDSLGNIVHGTTNYEMQNIALVPGTNTAVMLNSINNGNPNFPSASNPTPPSNPQYYRQNPDYGKMVRNKTKCFMNGYTTKLSTALVNVVADYYYKIEIDIADISDAGQNSAVYLSRDLRRFDTILVDTVICDNQEYYFDKLDMYISESGEYRHTAQNETGGDIYTIVKVQVNPTEYVSQCWSLVEGGSVEMNGLTISDTGMYVTHLETELGCDSTVVLNFYWGDEIKEINCPNSGSGLSEVEIAEKIKVFPNPAQNVLNITGIEYNTYIGFYDNNGRIMKEVNANPNESIDISSLPDGIYYLRILYGEKYIVKRLIKR